MLALYRVCCVHDTVHSSHYGTQHLLFTFSHTRLRHIYILTGLAYKAVGSSSSLHLAYTLHVSRHVSYLII